MRKERSCTYRDLRVWEEGVALAAEVYAETSRFPDAEKYGLMSQMRRSAVSVPVNIAEGAGRGSQREFLRFLLIARGSLTELETLVSIATLTGILSAKSSGSIQVRTESVSRLLNGLISSTRSRIIK